MGATATNKNYVIRVENKEIMLISVATAPSIRGYYIEVQGQATASQGRSKNSITCKLHVRQGDSDRVLETVKGIDLDTVMQELMDIVRQQYIKTDN